jgi:RNA polymerase sigma-70 factor (ECF subfamily)
MLIDTADEELIGRVRNGEIECYEPVMRRYNQRLFRLVRGILGDEHEAEDTLQQAYMHAYEHLDQFAGNAKFSTWLTRIALYEALARSKRRRRTDQLDDSSERTLSDNVMPNPEQSAMRTEARAVLESAIDALPESYRCVFILREVEGMSTGETADTLDLSEPAVKVRLHRARALLKRDLTARFGVAGSHAFEFQGARCDRVVHCVLERIRLIKANERGAMTAARRA